ncbi:MAG TPA: DUF5615 family PIN-like protein [Pirellulales bacterium]|jgi:hypothetical protein
MAVALYMDVHVPMAVTDQLRRRTVDVLTAIEDESSRMADDELLDRAGQLARIVVTFDIRFRAMAHQWQSTGRKFFGLIYTHPLRVSIGQMVGDLELIAKATEPNDWHNIVEQLPL